MQDNVALLQLLDRWIETIGRCMTTPLSMPSCKPFWEYVLYASAAVGTVLLLWAGWKMVEKFDDNRLRVKRPASAQRSDYNLPPGFDPYRTAYGETEAKSVLLVTVESVSDNRLP